jgi:hypothetical protein
MHAGTLQAIRSMAEQISNRAIRLFSITGKNACVLVLNDEASAAQGLISALNGPQVQTRFYLAC